MRILISILMWLWVLSMSAQSHVVSNDTVVSADSVVVAENFRSMTAEGRVVELDSLPTGRLTILVFFDPDCGACRQAIFGLKHSSLVKQLIDEQVLQEPLWLRDLSYASRISDYPQVLTTVVGESVVSNMMNRLESLNELYTPQAYLTDLSKLVFAEADSHKKVTPYRMTLQNTMFQHLQRALGNGNTQVRPAVLYTLQQLLKKIKAASQSAPDLESRAHWANLYDQAGRLLSWD